MGGPAELDEARARLAEEQTAHATLRALWDARCGTIASVQARLTEAEELLGECIADGEEIATEGLYALGLRAGRANVSDVETDFCIVAADAIEDRVRAFLAPRLAALYDLALVAERAAHALTRARLEAAERVVEAARALEFAVLLEAGAREKMHAPRAVLAASLTHRADVLAALDAAASSRAEGLAPIILHVTPGDPAPRCEHGWPLPEHSFVAKCQACRIAVLERAAMAARVVVDSFARDEWSTADEELDAALRKAGF